MGPPNDAAFQRRVLMALLGLLEAPGGPLLEDFPDDEPESAEKLIVLACPENFTQAAVETGETDQLKAAFRQEIVLYVLLLILLFFLPISILFKIILFVANTIVLLVELINSAIEAIVDMVSPEYNELAKHAKDLGSAAVLISLILAIVLWGLAVYAIFMNMLSV